MRLIQKLINEKEIKCVSLLKKKFQRWVCSTGTVTVGKFIGENSTDDKGLRVDLMHGRVPFCDKLTLHHLSPLNSVWRLPWCPGVKTLPLRPVEMGSVPGWGTKVSHCVRQLKPACCKYWCPSGALVPARESVVAEWKIHATQRRHHVSQRRLSSQINSK